MSAEDGAVSPISDGCICPHKIGPMGFLHGVNMGKGKLRTSTTQGCPVHDTCQGYTKAVRAARPSWSNPWCPIHAGRNCPPGDAL